MARAATSASVMPMCFENAVWPMPTIAARGRGTAGGVAHRDGGMHAKCLPELDGPPLAQPRHDDLLGDAILRMAQLRTLGADRVQVVARVRELTVHLVGRSGLLEH